MSIHWYDDDISHINLHTRASDGVIARRSGFATRLAASPIASKNTVR
jgi:hypothetical protein